MSFDLSTEDAAKAVSLLPVGFHLVKIVEAQAGKSSGQYPQVELRVEKTKTGDGLRDWKVVTEGSIPFVLQLTDAAGIDRSNMIFESAEEAAEKIAKLIDGREVGVKVEDQPKRDGTGTRRVVASYWAPSELPQSAFETDVPPDTEGLPQSSAVGAGAVDDDIPF